jgi:adenylate cyclase
VKLTEDHGQKPSDYTTLAHRYTARFPILTYVGTQVNFWILANVLLVIIVRLYTYVVSELYETPVPGRFTTTLYAGIILGLLYGIGFGLTGYYLDRKVFKKAGLGVMLSLKTLISSILFIMIFLIFRFVIFDSILSPTFGIDGTRLNEEAWWYLFFMLLIYYFFMTLVISFINQVNRKYGPGVLVPLLLGRYRHPREEEKIFMFMDLKSSTTTAENLGHLAYSSFIRDCFYDINEVLYPFRAQVYQYVGDEIVVMWPVREGLRDLACIRFYFAVSEQIRGRTGHYLSRYGFLPAFKAGMHMGKVTAVEIGEIKKDIAYHGDTLNTASRIQSVCNEYQCDFLVSEYLIEKTDIEGSFKTDHLGAILLRGKSERMGIVSVKEGSFRSH